MRVLVLPVFLIGCASPGLAPLDRQEEFAMALPALHALLNNGIVDEGVPVVFCMPNSHELDSAFLAALKRPNVFACSLLSSAGEASREVMEPVTLCSIRRIAVTNDGLGGLVEGECNSQVRRKFRVSLIKNSEQWSVIE